jgi:hypothetical protein
MELRPSLDALTPHKKDTANDFRQNLEQCDVNQLAQEKVCPPLCKAHFETVFSDLGCCYPEIADLLYETVAPVDVVGVCV